MPVRPIIIAVDDDPEVARAVARDLRQQYAKEYRIVSANSAPEALRTVEALAEQGEPVALILADQRMPELSGVDLLARVHLLMPETRRVLLTAYADTEAAIAAINRVRLHHYLLKPWHPPEQHLYPVLDDLLGDWRGSFRMPFEGVRVIDHRWSPRGHQVRDFLSRNQVPYRWLDLESPEGQRLLGPDFDPAALPLIVLEDGSRLLAPTPTALAVRLGLSTRAASPFYDLVIVGAGPAGLAAAVYGASEGLRCAVVEREAPGGQAGTSSKIENYLGFPSGLSGSDLARRAHAQARRFGAEMILTQEVRGLRHDAEYRYVDLADGTALSCHALLIASGVAYRTLDAPGVAELAGAGVYYGAALSEARDCTEGDVFIIGAGNSAGQSALSLAKHARSVTILCRRDGGLKPTMSRYLLDEIDKCAAIRVRSSTVLAAAEGDGRLERVVLHDLAGDRRETLAATALFIHIGAQPCTEWVGDALARDPHGFILTGADLPRGREHAHGWALARDPFLTETSLPGVFAAGDVRRGSVKRVATAVGEGSITVQFVHQYLAQR